MMTVDRLLGIAMIYAGLDVRVNSRRMDGPGAQADTWTLWPLDAGLPRRPRPSRRQAAQTRRLSDAEEALRRRIACDLHDALGQPLTAMKLDVDWIFRHLEPHQTDLSARMAAMDVLIAQTIAEVRRLSAELRPAVLDDQGLLAAIRWLVVDFQRHGGATCDLRLPDVAPDWGPRRRTAAFRVLQEALTNVARHAQARRVQVGLWTDRAGAALLEICDDGKGICAEAVSRSLGLGLSSMRERARLHGGALLVRGAPGAGTTVRLRLPCGPPRRPGGPEPAGMPS